MDSVMASSSIRETKGFEIQTRDMPTQPKRTSLIGTLKAYPHYLHRKRMVTINENLNFDIRVKRVKSVLTSVATT